MGTNLKLIKQDIEFIQNQKFRTDLDLLEIDINSEFVDELFSLLRIAEGKVNTLQDLISYAVNNKLVEIDEEVK